MFFLLLLRQPVMNDLLTRVKKRQGPCFMVDTKSGNIPYEMRPKTDFACIHIHAQLFPDLFCLPHLLQVSPRPLLQGITCSKFYFSDSACSEHMSLGFSRQEYWSGLPRPVPGDLPDTGIEPTSLSLQHWQAGFLPPVPPGKPETSYNL